MNKQAKAKLYPYLDKLQELTAAKEIELEGGQAAGTVVLRIDTQEGFQLHYAVLLVEGGTLSTAMVGKLAADGAGKQQPRCLVLAPVIPQAMGRRLETLGIDYLDAAGNCHLTPDARHRMHVEGRRDTKPRQTAAIGPLGYQALFALLARPELVAEPIRQIAQFAGVGKTAVGQLIERLVDEGHVRETRRGRILFRPATLLQRWVTGYGDALRPRLMIQRYQAAKADRNQLTERIATYLNTLPEQVPWGFGGTTGGDALTGHYAGATVTLHLEAIPADFGRAVRLLPAREGDVVVLRAPGPIAYDGRVPNSVHPLLIYTELLTTDDERAWEMARIVLDDHLPWLK